MKCIDSWFYGNRNGEGRSHLASNLFLLLAKIWTVARQQTIIQMLYVIAGDVTMKNATILSSIVRLVLTRSTIL